MEPGRDSSRDTDVVTPGKEAGFSLAISVVELKIIKQRGPNMITGRMNRDVAMPAAAIFPQSLAPGSLNTGGVDMTMFRRLLAVLKVGVFGALATVDMKLQQSNDPTFTVGTIDVPAAAITQLLAAGGNNKVATVEITADQISLRYVRARVTVGVAATLIACDVYACNPASPPAVSVDDASVVQRVNPPAVGAGVGQWAIHRSEVTCVEW